MNAMQSRHAIAYRLCSAAFALALTLYPLSHALADDGESGEGSRVNTLGTITAWGVRPEIQDVSSWFDFYTSVTSDPVLMIDNFGIPRVDTGFDASDKKCPKSGNPIIPGTANKIETDLDFESAAPEMPLRFSRTYNANLMSDGQGYPLLSHGWRSNLDYWMYGDEDEYGNGFMVASRPDGRLIKFKHVGGHRYNEEKAGSIAYILVTYSSDYKTWFATHHTEDGEVETYQNGNIIKRQNAHGVGWTFSWNPWQYALPSGAVYTRQRLHRVTHDSGKYIEFTHAGHYVSTVRDPQGQLYRYALDPHKSLLGRVETPAGTVITYHYENPHHSSPLTGKSINGVRFSTFGYSSPVYPSAQGMFLSRVFPISTEHAGGTDRYTFSYTYDASLKILSAVETNPLGRRTKYLFNSKGNVTSVTGYATTHCAGAYKNITYDANHYVNMVTDFEGNVTDFDHDMAGRLIRKVEAFGTPLARVTLYTWDVGNNRLISVEQQGLSRVTYAYGTDNRLTSITRLNLSSHGVASQARVTSYWYDKHPNGLISRLTIDGPVPGISDQVTITYSADGNMHSSRNSLGHEVVFGGYNGLGLPGTTLGTNGQLIDYSYDIVGRITRKRTYPNGIAADTLYTYSPEGLLSRIIHADGTRLHYFYDASRRLRSQSTPEVGINYAKKEYAYNLAGDVLSTIISRATASTPPPAPPLVPPGPTPPPPPPPPPGGGGGWCDGPICYDPLSASGGKQMPSGGPDMSVMNSTTQFFKQFTDYDELSRPRASRGNNGQNVRYTYDLNGNIKTVTDSLNRVTTMHYDALDRLVASTDPLNQTTYFEYDAGDRLTKVTDPRGKVTTYVYDGFGQLWAQHSPDTGTTTFTYTSASLTSMRRGGDDVTTYSYDGLGRLTEIRQVTGVGGGGKVGRINIQSFGYDWCSNGKGRLCNADYNDGTRHYGYTPEGQVSTTRDWTPTSDEWTGYTYDNMGRLTGMGYPSGISVGYGYSHGKLTVMQATIGGVTHNVATGMQYQPFGPMTRMTYGNGVIKERTFDLDGRLATTHDHGMVGHTQHYNVNNEITLIENWSRSTYNQQFTYDALSRLTGISSPSGNQSLSYDANGNRTRHVWSYDVPYNVDPNSNRVLNEAISYAYDERGNRVAQSWGGSTATYVYGAFNRLSSVSRNVASSYSNPATLTSRTYPAGTTTYTTNALGQRTAKSGPSGSSRFVYAGQNTLLTEYTNGVWSSYLWLGSEPIAVVRNNQLFFLHNDHLGRPEVVTDSARSARWVAANYAFDRAVLWSTFGELNLGLPGQYFDAETGFWYNGFRDYDSRLGQYIQSDPIGLAGGLNTYAYVFGNPVSLIDPLGLEAPGSFNNGGTRLTWESGGNARLPDYVRLNVNLYVFSASRSWSRSGSMFVAAGVSRSYFNPLKIQASLSVGWLNQCERPTGAEVDNLLEGFGMSGASGYKGVGAGQSWSPGQGTATELGIGVGAGFTPGEIGVRDGSLGGGW